MHCETTEQLSNARVWALEPEVTPLPARWAIVIGVLVGAILLALSMGMTPVTDGEEWHGNVAASQAVAR